MIGATFAHYQILGPLGRGGMGVVYEAEDTRLGRKVALKLLPDEVATDERSLQRFLREAKVVASLSHPHICVLHDIGTHEGKPFMVMELLEGESLKDRLARGPLPWREVARFGQEIADGLDAAHTAGVIHRDLKPANLFLTRRAGAKVLDFGVAKLAHADPAAPDLEQTVASADQLTQQGSAIGTIGYMSPEQARGEAVDARSDIFSLGVVLYEMVSGRAPFEGATPAVIYEGILTRTPPALTSIVPAIPAGLEEAIARAMQKSPSARYGSAAEFREALAHSGSGSAPTRAQPPLVQSPRVWLIAAPLATAAIVAGVVLWTSSRVPALSARDPVVLAQIENRTGDPVFDQTLGEALALQLRQSPFLNVLPEQQLEPTLRMMGRDPAAPVTAETGNDLCQRVGAKALLGGSVAALGSSYLLRLTAHECGTGRVLAEEEGQADGKEQVIAALGAAASRFREKLGESLPSLRGHDARIEQATTPSLEALKAYTQGTVTRRTSGDAESVPFFRRAVEVDPEFALAHARLGTVLGNLRDEEGAKTATARAYELRNRVSDRERLYIEARYFTAVAEDLPRAIDAYNRLLASYPDDFAAHTNLGGLYRQQGRLQLAITHLEQSVRLSPDQPIGHTNLGDAYLRARRFDEALAAYQTSRKLQDSAGARSGIFTVAIVQGNGALAEAQTQGMSSRPEVTQMLFTQVAGALYQGKVARAAQLIDELDRVSAGAPRREQFAEPMVGMGIGFALLGAEQAARQQLARAMVNGALPADAADEALNMAAILGDQRLAAMYLPTALNEAKQEPFPERVEGRMRAVAAMAHGQMEDAARLRGVSSGDETPEHEDFLSLIAVVEQKHWTQAAEILERMKRFPFELSPLMPFLDLLEARTMTGLEKTDAARAAYERAFAVWKSADADLPVLVRARAAYAELGR